MFPFKNAPAVGRLIFFLSIVQTVSVAQPGPVSVPIPETGYVSRSSYVNAFFGFLLPLLQDADFHDLALPTTANSHSIFGLQTQRKGLTALTVTATQSKGNPAVEAQKTAEGVKGASVKKVEIGGREFWKSESEDKSHAGMMYTAIYATTMRGFTLQFMVVSFDAKVAKELQHSIESIIFVDPAQAKVLAGKDAHQFPARTAGAASRPSPSPAHIAQLSPGTISGNTYTNRYAWFFFRVSNGMGCRG